MKEKGNEANEKCVLCQAKETDKSKDNSTIGVPDSQADSLPISDTVAAEADTHCEIRTLIDIWLTYNSAWLRSALLRLRLRWQEGQGGS